MAALVIARLTLAESIRRRIIWVLLGLTVFSVAITTWGVERLVSLARENGTGEVQIFIGVSQILVLVAFMFSFVLAMTAAFLGAPAIAADVESGVAHAMLARPIRRADLVVGRWLGLSVVVLAYAAVSGLLEIAAVRLVSGYAPPNPLEAVAYLAAQAIVLMTVALLLSTRLPAMASGAICVVLFGLGWMAGVFAGIGRLLDAGALVSVAEATRWLLPTDGLWRGAIHALQPPLVVLVAAGRLGSAADANPFFATSAPDPAFLAWCVVWTAVVLGLAALSLERRDL
jgi:ABC-type transport system involved in multi-copper enzyme maturation permease subunit